MLNCGASLDPEVNMKGCEDFLTIVLHAHIASAAKKLLAKQKYDNVMDLAQAILENYTNFEPSDKTLGMTRYSCIPPS